MLQECNPYHREMFARGYLLSDASLPWVPAGWKSFVFVGHHVTFEPRLPVALVESAHSAVLCLGVAFDIRAPALGTPDVTRELHVSLQKSEDAFLDHLAFLGGRHVVFYKRAGASVTVVTDATGMKSAFYHHGEAVFVASHPALLAEVAPAVEPLPPFPARFGYPGLRPPFSNVLRLSPNMKLPLNKQRPQRFWPRARIPKRPLVQAADQFSRYFCSSMLHMQLYHRPIVSLTAGLDSRATLAAARPFLRRTRFFTYYRSDQTASDRYDRWFAEDVRDDFELDLEVLEIAKTQVAIPRSFRELLSLNTHLSHVPSGAWEYYRRFGGGREYMHIRSNVSEIGREFYGGTKKVRSASDLARLYLRNNPKRSEREYVKEVRERFEEFAEITDFLNCGDRIALRSLFYWEFRMGAWHAQVVANSDPAFDTVSLYNCRHILTLMLSVPPDVRREARVLRRVIRKNWPELSRYPVNGKPFALPKRRPRLPASREPSLQAHGE